MNINKIINLIENFAPPVTQENWDCSGYQILNKSINKDVKKVLLCLSFTENVIEQAITNGCDLIIAHHPLFFIPFNFNKNIPIYSAHTNLDKANGGTTDTLIKILGFNEAQKIGDFLRLVELQDGITLSDFINLVKVKLKIEHLKIVNNKNINGTTILNKIAFCAGSGTEFLTEAQNSGAYIFVTGDVKYHTALDSNVIIFDVGHFESERPVLNTIKELIKPLNVEVIIADEKSPFINY